MAIFEKMRARGAKGHENVSFGECFFFSFGELLKEMRVSVFFFFFKSSEGSFVSSTFSLKGRISTYKSYFFQFSQWLGTLLCQLHGVSGPGAGPRVVESPGLDETGSRAPLSRLF